MADVALAVGISSEEAQSGAKAVTDELGKIAAAFESLNRNSKTFSDSMGGWANSKSGLSDMAGAASNAANSMKSMQDSIVTATGQITKAIQDQTTTLQGSLSSIKSTKDAYTDASNASKDYSAQIARLDYQLGIINKSTKDAIVVTAQLEALYQNQGIDAQGYANRIHALEQEIVATTKTAIAVENANTRMQVADTKTTNQVVASADKVIASQTKLGKLEQDHITNLGKLQQAYDRTGDQKYVNAQNSQTEAFNKQKAALLGLSPATDKLTQATIMNGGALREVFVMLHELGTGQTSRLAGSAWVLLAERTNIVQKAFEGVSLTGGLAMAGTVALAAGFLAASVRASSLNSELRTLQGLQHALGTASGLTPNQVQALRQSSSQNYGLSNNDAIKSANKMTSTQGLSGSAYQPIMESALGVSKVLGDDVPAAVKKMSEAFSHGAAGVLDLNKSLNFLDADSAKAVLDLASQGDAAGATALALASLSAKYGPLGDKMSSDMEKATHQVDVAWNLMLDDISKSDATSKVKSSFVSMVEGTADFVTGIHNMGTAISALMENPYVEMLTIFAGTLAAVALAMSSPVLAAGAAVGAAATSTVGMATIGTAAVLGGGMAASNAYVKANPRESQQSVDAHDTFIADTSEDISKLAELNKTTQEQIALINALPEDKWKVEADNLAAVTNRSSEYTGELAKQNAIVAKQAVVEATRAATIRDMNNSTALEISLIQDKTNAILLDNKALLDQNNIRATAINAAQGKQGFNASDPTHPLQGSVAEAAYNTTQSKAQSELDQSKASAAVALSYSLIPDEAAQHTAKLNIDLLTKEKAKLEDKIAALKDSDSTVADSAQKIDAYSQTLKRMSDALDVATRRQGALKSIMEQSADAVENAKFLAAQPAGDVRNQAATKSNAYDIAINSGQTVTSANKISNNAVSEELVKEKMARDDASAAMQRQTAEMLALAAAESKGDESEIRSVTTHNKVIEATVGMTDAWQIWQKTQDISANEAAKYALQDAKKSDGLNNQAVNKAILADTQAQLTAAELSGNMESAHTIELTGKMAAAMVGKDDAERASIATSMARTDVDKRANDIAKIGLQIAEQQRQAANDSKSGMAQLNTDTSSTGVNSDVRDKLNLEQELTDLYNKQGEYQKQLQSGQAPDVAYAETMKKYETDRLALQKQHEAAAYSEIQGQQQTLLDLHDQVSVQGLSADKQAAALQALKDQREVHKLINEGLTEQANAYEANAKAIADQNAELQKQKDINAALGAAASAFAAQAAGSADLVKQVNNLVAQANGTAVSSDQALLNSLQDRVQALTQQQDFMYHSGITGGNSQINAAQIGQLSNASTALQQEMSDKAAKAAVDAYMAFITTAQSALDKIKDVSKGPGTVVQDNSALVKSYNDLLSNTADSVIVSLAQVRTQISSLNDQITKVGSSSTITAADLDALQSTLDQKLTKSFMDPLIAGLASMTNDTDTQLKQLADTQLARLTQAVELGGDLGVVQQYNYQETLQFYQKLSDQQVTALNATGDALASILQEAQTSFSAGKTAVDAQLKTSQDALTAANSSAQAYRSIAQSASDTIQSLRIGPNSTLSSQDQLAAARANFTQLIAPAMGGDQTAQQALLKAAQPLIDASKAVNASNPAYAADNKMVQDTLAQLESINGGLASAADYQAAMVQSQVNLLTQIQQNLSQGTTVDQALLQQQLSALQAVQGQLAGISALTQAGATLNAQNSQAIIAANSSVGASVAAAISTGTVSNVSALQSNLSYLGGQFATVSGSSAEQVRGAIATLQDATSSGLVTDTATTSAALTALQNGVSAVLSSGNAASAANAQAIITAQASAGGIIRDAVNIGTVSNQTALQSNLATLAGVFNVNTGTLASMAAQNAAAIMSEQAATAAQVQGAITSGSVANQSALQSNLSALATTFSTATGAGAAQVQGAIATLQNITSSGLVTATNAAPTTNALANLQAGLSTYLAANNNAVTLQTATVSNALGTLQSTTATGLVSTANAATTTAALAALQSGVQGYLGANNVAVNSQTGQVVALSNLTASQLAAIQSGNTLTQTQTAAVTDTTGAVLQTNATQQLIKELTSTNVDYAKSIIDAVNGSASTTATVSSAVASGDNNIIDALSTYLSDVKNATTTAVNNSADTLSLALAAATSAQSQANTIAQSNAAAAAAAAAAQLQAQNDSTNALHITLAPLTGSMQSIAATVPGESANQAAYAGLDLMKSLTTGADPSTAPTSDHGKTWGASYNISWESLLQKGMAATGQAFDPNRYLRLHPDRVTAGITSANAIDDYATYGIQHGYAYAAGGWITGGTPGKDSVPIMSMPGEFVVNAQSARQNAPMLEAMNSGVPLPMPVRISAPANGNSSNNNAELIAVINDMKAELRELRKDNMRLLTRLDATVGQNTDAVVGILNKNAQQQKTSTAMTNALDRRRAS